MNGYISVWPWTFKMCHVVRGLCVCLYVHEVTGWLTSITSWDERPVILCEPSGKELNKNIWHRHYMLFI